MGTSELYIVKRDGKREVFSVEKIKRAVRRAFLSVGGYATDEDLISVLSRVHVSDGMSVEEIQNQVEVALMAERYFAVAKSYMLYRLPPEVIARCVFPLGETEDKAEVRELARRAGSLYPGGPAPVSRAALAGAIARELLALCPGFDCLDEYRARCFVPGHWVTVCAETETYAAKALAIDEEGRLVIQRENGRQEALRCGEVTTRPARTE